MSYTAQSVKTLPQAELEDDQTIYNNAQRNGPSQIATSRDFLWDREYWAESRVHPGDRNVWYALNPRFSDLARYYARHAQWAEKLLGKMVHQVEAEERRAAAALAKMYGALAQRMSRRTYEIENDIFYRNPFIAEASPMATIEDIQRTLEQRKPAFKGRGDSAKGSSNRTVSPGVKTGRGGSALGLLARWFNFHLHTQKNDDVVASVGGSHRRVAPIHRLTWRTPFLTENEITNKKIMEKVGKKLAGQMTQAGLTGAVVGGQAALLGGAEAGKAAAGAVATQALKEKGSNNSQMKQHGVWFAEDEKSKTPCAQLGGFDECSEAWKDENKRCKFFFQTSLGDKPNAEEYEKSDELSTLEDKEKADAVQKYLDGGKCRPVMCRDHLSEADCHDDSNNDCVWQEVDSRAEDSTPELYRDLFLQRTQHPELQRKLVHPDTTTRAQLTVAEDLLAGWRLPAENPATKQPPRVCHELRRMVALKRDEERRRLARWTDAAERGTELPGRVLSEEDAARGDTGVVTKDLAASQMQASRALLSRANDVVHKYCTPAHCEARSSAHRIRDDSRQYHEFVHNLREVHFGRAADKASRIEETKKILFDAMKQGSGASAGEDQPDDGEEELTSALFDPETGLDKRRYFNSDTGLEFDFPSATDENMNESANADSEGANDSASADGSSAGGIPEMSVEGPTAAKAGSTPSSAAVEEMKHILDGDSDFEGLKKKMTAVEESLRDLRGESAEAKAQLLESERARIFNGDPRFQPHGIYHMRLFGGTSVAALKDDRDSDFQEEEKQTSNERQVNIDEAEKMEAAEEAREAAVADESDNKDGGPDSADKDNAPTESEKSSLSENNNTAEKATAEGSDAKDTSSSTLDDKDTLDKEPASSSTGAPQPSQQTDKPPQHASSSLEVSRTSNSKSGRSTASTASRRPVHEPYSVIPLPNRTGSSFRRTKNAGQLDVTEFLQTPCLYLSDNPWPRKPSPGRRTYVFHRGRRRKATASAFCSPNATPASSTGCTKSELELDGRRRPVVSKNDGSIIYSSLWASRSSGPGKATSFILHRDFPRDYLEEGNDKEPFISAIRTYEMHDENVHGVYNCAGRARLEELHQLYDRALRSVRRHVFEHLPARYWIDAMQNLGHLSGSNGQSAGSGTSTDTSAASSRGSSTSVSTSEGGVAAKDDQIQVPLRMAELSDQEHWTLVKESVRVYNAVDRFVSGVQRRLGIELVEHEIPRGLYAEMLQETSLLKDTARDLFVERYKCKDAQKMDPFSTYGDESRKQAGSTGLASLFLEVSAVEGDDREKTTDGMRGEYGKQRVAHLNARCSRLQGTRKTKAGDHRRISSSWFLSFFDEGHGQPYRASEKGTRRGYRRKVNRGSGLTFFSTAEDDPDATQILFSAPLARNRKDISSFNALTSKALMYLGRGRAANARDANALAPVGGSAIATGCGARSSGICLQLHQLGYDPVDDRELTAPRIVVPLTGSARNPRHGVAPRVRIFQSQFYSPGTSTSSTSTYTSFAGRGDPDYDPFMEHPTTEQGVSYADTCMPDFSKLTASLCSYRVPYGG
ncbi:unnamed protein product [Amoebophrya sp. A25]|nr:unnamed protein product [Amoebophrya sp. A25]|eukprot:GSA25T00002017001.1